MHLHLLRPLGFTPQRVPRLITPRHHSSQRPCHTSFRGDALIPIGRLHRRCKIYRRLRGRRRQCLGTCHGIPQFLQLHAHRRHAVLGIRRSQAFAQAHHHATAFRPRHSGRPHALCARRSPHAIRQTEVGRRAQRTLPRVVPFVQPHHGAASFGRRHANRFMARLGTAVDEQSRFVQPFPA